MRAEKLLFIKVDNRRAYKEVIEIIDIAKRAGVDNIGMVYVYPEERVGR